MPRRELAPDVHVCACMWPQIEKAREHGPEAFKQCLQAALDYSKHAGGAEPLGWHWVACEACEQWRLVSGG